MQRTRLAVCFVAGLFLLMRPLSVCAYDVVYHQDADALTVDGKFALMPSLEQAIVSKVALTARKFNLPKNSMLTIKVDQDGKVVEAACVNKSLSKLMHSFRFGKIPCGVGTRTLLLTFRLDELSTTPNRRNVAITAGADTRH